MLTRWMWLVTAVGLATLPAQVRAADEKSPLPTAQISLRSLDALLEDLKYLLSSTDQKDAAKLLDDTLKMNFPNAFEGIDRKKPWALYGVLEPDLLDSSGVLMIPVSDEKAFIGLVEKHAQLKPTKDGDYYVYHHPSLPFPIYVRFTAGYAFATVREKTALKDGKLRLPSKVFAGPQETILGMRLRVDQIPDTYKQMMVGQLEASLASEQTQPGPNERPFERAGRILGAKMTVDVVRAILREGAELSLDAGVSPKREGIILQLGLTGSAGSDLAKRIVSMSKMESMFAAWVKPKSVFSVIVNFPLSEDFRKMMVLFLEDELSKGPAKDNPSLAEKIRKALRPTLNASSLETALDIRGPSSKGHYTLVNAFRIVDGDKIDALFGEWVKEMPEKQRAAFKMEPFSIGTCRVYQRVFTGPRKEVDRQLFGDGPVYFTFCKEAFFISVGEQSLDALREAIQSGSRPSPAVHAELAIAKFVPLLKQLPFTETEFAKLESQKWGIESLRFLIEGGEALKIRLEMNLPMNK
jgi:hypothetical protein